MKFSGLIITTITALLLGLGLYVTVQNSNVMIETVSNVANPQKAISLTIDKEGAITAKPSIALNLKWGNKDYQVDLEVYKEVPKTFGTPSSYSINEDGTIAVYDTATGKLKIFTNNDVIKAYKINESVRDVAFSAGKGAYAIDYSNNKLYNIKTGKFTILLDEKTLKKPETIDIMPNGNLLIKDNEGYKIFDIDGNSIKTTIKDNELAFNHYEFQTNDGEFITINNKEDGIYKIKLYNTQGVEKYTMLFDALVNKDNKNKYSNISPLGIDKLNNVYFWIEEDRKNPNSKEFIVRINVNSKQITTLNIYRTDWNMDKSTANASNRFIRMDNNGNIYQLNMTYKGFKILKYSLPETETITLID